MEEREEDLFFFLFLHTCMIDLFSRFNGTIIGCKQYVVESRYKYLDPLGICEARRHGPNRWKNNHDGVKLLRR